MYDDKFSAFCHFLQMCKKYWKKTQNSNSVASVFSPGPLFIKNLQDQKLRSRKISAKEQKLVGTL